MKTGKSAEFLEVTVASLVGTENDRDLDLLLTLLCHSKPRFQVIREDDPQDDDPPPTRPANQQFLAAA